MTNNLKNPPQLKFTHIDTVANTIIAGAAGWIDTDVSATTGTDQNKLWVIAAQSAGGTTSGVRFHNSANTPTTRCELAVTFLSKVDTTGHLDLYRGTSDITYNLIGYIQVI